MICRLRKYMYNYTHPLVQPYIKALQRMTRLHLYDTVNPITVPCHSYKQHFLQRPRTLGFGKDIRENYACYSLLFSVKLHDSAKRPCGER